MEEYLVVPPREVDVHTMSRLDRLIGRAPPQAKIVIEGSHTDLIGTGPLRLLADRERRQRGSRGSLVVRRPNWGVEHSLREARLGHLIESGPVGGSVGQRAEDAEEGTGP